MCGKSLNGPLCDGNHKGSGIGPKAITYDKDTTIHVCGCQQSKGRPICDGTHKTISE
jgi:CDGSH-type Zn-finger protein